MVLHIVFSRVTMEEDFDIKMEQCAVIYFFVQKGKSLKETINALGNVLTEDELLSAPTFIPSIKCTRKVGKMPPCIITRTTCQSNHIS